MREFLSPSFLSLLSLQFFKRKARSPKYFAKVHRFFWLDSEKNLLEYKPEISHPTHYRKAVSTVHTEINATRLLWATIDSAFLVLNFSASESCIFQICHRHFHLHYPLNDTEFIMRLFPTFPFLHLNINTEDIFSLQVARVHGWCISTSSHSLVIFLSIYRPVRLWVRDQSFNISFFYIYSSLPAFTGHPNST